MSINTLLVGPKEYNWNSHTDRVFLTNKNVLKIINDNILYDCCTSLEDLTYKYISQTIKNVKNIKLVNIDSDYILNINDDHQNAFFSFIKLAIDQNKLIIEENLLDTIFQKLNLLQKNRTSDDPVLWTVGCSFTAGVGVEETQRYGYLLSKSLNLEEITLSQGGSSISWAADQILRSDIRKNDTIVWGITQPGRINSYDKFDIVPVTIHSYHSTSTQQHLKINYFHSLTLVISNFKQILHVINFCNKIGAKLYLANFLDPGLTPLLLKRFTNFIDLSGNYDTETYNYEFIDLGSDNAHPGPKHHKYYADKIFEFIKTTNYEYKNHRP